MCFSYNILVFPFFIHICMGMPYLHCCHRIVLTAVIYQRDKFNAPAFSQLLASVVWGVAALLVP